MKEGPLLYIAQREEESAKGVAKKGRQRECELGGALGNKRSNRLGESVGVSCRHPPIFLTPSSFSGNLVVKSVFLVVKRHLEVLKVVKDPRTLGLDLPIKSLVRNRLDKNFHFVYSFGVL